jgi:hypothetical protein
MELQTDRQILMNRWTYRQRKRELETDRQTDIDE